MEDALPSLPVPITSAQLPWPLNLLVWGYSYTTFFMSIVVVVLITLGFGLLARRAQLVPGRRQSLLELVVEFLREVVYGTLGPKDGRVFLPFIGTIFLFVWVSNVIGILPTGDIFRWINAITGREGGPDLLFQTSAGTFVLPGAVEPSRDVNFPWGLGIMVFFLMHILAIWRKGMGAYLDEYFQPHLGKITIPYQKVWARGLMALFGLVVAGGFGYIVGLFVGSQWAGGPYESLRAAAPWAGRALGGALGLYAAGCYAFKPKWEPKAVGIPNLFIAPLNIIGKFAEILSMCFRLFGNIFGGAIIIVLIGSFIQPLLPIFLQGFFGLFVGTVQAFVFAVLCLTYIAVEIREEESEELDVVEGEPSHTAGAGAA